MYRGLGFRDLNSLKGGCIGYYVGEYNRSP